MEYTLACIWCYYYDDGLEKIYSAAIIMIAMQKKFNLYSANTANVKHGERWKRCKRGKHSKHGKRIIK